MEEYSKKEKLLLKIAFGMQKAMKLEIKAIDWTLRIIDRRRIKLLSTRWKLFDAIDEIDEYR